MTDRTQGTMAVEIARKAIASALAGEAPKDPATPFRTVRLPSLFDEPRGVFVTLTEARDGALRGCIGYPVAVYPLRAAIPRAAVAAATEDPRFPTLSRAEVDRTIVEVSLLTVPEPLDVAEPADRPRAIRVGRDGLIVDAEGGSGLLLPQVASEQGWDATTFLAETCRKAGLPLDAWRSPRTRIRRFQAEIFHELRPGGPVEVRGADPSG